MAKETIQKEIGYSCSYVPLEILDSFGLKTIYIIGDPLSPDSSQGYVNQNICGFCKHICSRPKNQVYDMIFTDCCDAMLALHHAYVLHPEFDDNFKHLVFVPRSFEKIDVAYWVRTLELFIQTIEKATGKAFSESRLAESIKKFNRMRNALRQAEKMLLENTIWGSEYVKLLFSLYDAGVDKATTLTEDFIKAHKDDDEKETDYSILVSGSNMFAALQLAEHIEEHDGNVRYFDTCNLARFYNMEVSESASPLEAVAEAYLTKIPCARMKNSTLRLENLIRLFKEYEMDMAVYHTVKFCAPHIYDFIEFKELCKENNVPLIRIETNHDFDLPGQITTRIEAALEML